MNRIPLIWLCLALLLLGIVPGAFPQDAPPAEIPEEAEKDIQGNST